MIRHSVIRSDSRGGKPEQGVGIDIRAGPRWGQVKHTVLPKVNTFSRKSPVDENHRAHHDRTDTYPGPHRVPHGLTHTPPTPSHSARRHIGLPQALTPVNSRQHYSTSVEHTRLILTEDAVRHLVEKRALFRPSDERPGERRPIAVFSRDLSISGTTAGQCYVIVVLEVRKCAFTGVGQVALLPWTRTNGCVRGEGPSGFPLPRSIAGSARFRM